MASVRSTTPRRSPRAAHRSSEDQYGLIMAQARGSVRRKLILGGPSEWFLSTSRHGRLHLWHHRRAAIASDAKAPHQGDATGVFRRWRAIDGARLKHLAIMIHSEVPRHDCMGPGRGHHFSGRPEGVMKALKVAGRGDGGITMRQLLLMALRRTGSRGRYVLGSGIPL